ncbi:hypothetical protein [Mesorhizobium sp. M1342]|uniref:hypothetical protein n=1 Tax=Mesorhizobium sp. M1342 TaxID=2957088 RepID=UPI003338261D
MMLLLMVGRGISVIIRQGLSVSAIARESAGSTALRCAKYIARGLQAPAYGPRKPRQAVLDPFTAYLCERVTRYPRLTGSRLFRELKDLGYGGGYTALTDFLRDVRPAAAERGYEVRFETAPGEQAQVEFAQFNVVFADEPTTPRIVWLFSMVLGFIRLIWHAWSSSRIRRLSCAAMLGLSRRWAALLAKCFTTV